MTATRWRPPWRAGRCSRPGGGGWVDHGYLVGRTAVSYGTPRLATLDEVADDATIVTVSAIGAPAARDWEMRPGDYVRALRLLMEALDEPVVGTITAQNGSSTTCNGWVQSAVLGHAGDRRRRRRPRPSHRQDGLDGPGGGP